MNKPERPKGSETGRVRDERGRAIERVRRSLVRGGWPRLLVSFLLALTGAAGFLVSAVLLRLGVESMTMRYPLAVISAYCVFLLLLRLWLALKRRNGGDADWLLDSGDALPHLLDAGALGGRDAAAATFGGGTDFGGAGAGGAWSGSVPGGMSSGMSGGGACGVPGGGSGGASGGSWGSSSSSDWIPDVPDVLDVDLDEGCFWIVIPIAAIVGVVVAMFYVVYIAPIFLAEILVDALLLAGLYKRLKGVEPRHWLRSCVRRTLLPALVAVALFIAAGYLMERIAPEARSIGEFWQQIN